MHSHTMIIGIQHFIFVESQQFISKKPYQIFSTFIPVIQEKNGGKILEDKEVKGKGRKDGEGGGKVVRERDGGEGGRM